MREKDDLGNVTPLRAPKAEKDHPVMEAFEMFGMTIVLFAIIGGAVAQEALVFHEIHSNLNWFVKAIIGSVVFMEYMGSLLLIMVCAAPSAGKTKRQNITAAVIFIALAILIQAVLFVGLLSSVSGFGKCMALIAAVSALTYGMTYLVVK